jgi:putative ABC transport system ATP-binding protein
VSKLELLDVVKHYQSSGETVRAVDGVSLTIAHGEFVALYGPSGSGKTTLLLMAAAIMRPDSGIVRFGELEVSRLEGSESDRYRREQVGVIFQSFHLVAGVSALDNAGRKLLALGYKMGEAAEAARPWLERVGLGARLQHTTGELSMGERQRVAIARALASSPRLLLADEPTGNLDSKRSGEVLAMLKEIGREREIPILLVTHDAQAASIVDRVHTLRDGKITEGLSAELQPTVS